MRLACKWGSEPNPPGEPLYTIDEIGDRLETTGNRLKALIAKHPGLMAWKAVGGGSNTITPRHKLYRLSDARRWWATLPTRLTEPMAEVATC